MTGRASTQSIDKAASRRSWRIAETLSKSFSYASAGVIYATATQRNFRIHLGMGTLAFVLGAMLHVSLLEMAVIGLAVALVLAFELINTALEATVDLIVGEQYHRLAEIAKDCAAGAVLVVSFASLVVATCILLPPLWHLLAAKLLLV
ncbi:diacylglycerol kinase family protein [Gloeobacter kilaueensis]|uniref:Diacylglycerol kinase n=1 Tax=Gloeobacter kilaueensis (strain ATCC BAA-2537 / CCAP 1431/1 / ULC 316 / JS1) TaxID=1183438 RepID=U5QF52_GLOK1|nr:diacylglycerol kinase family protein [Gloeobacter kilaueensis]AGY57597.1 diacylglycerol kinase [Gloeobacter kilaueensis JS1]